MFFKACFFIFIKLNGKGTSPLPIPPLDKFLFKKQNDNVCELKGRCPVNELHRNFQRKCNGDLDCVFLTMEMNGINEHGYKIKGPH